MAQVINRHGVIGLGGTPGVPDSFSWKFSCRLSTHNDGNISIASCPATVDGFAMAGATVGDRIHVSGQTDPIENGLYAFNGVGNALTRTTDFDEAADVAGGATVTILEGSSLSEEIFILVSDFPTPGTDAINFLLHTGNPTIETVVKNSSFTLVANDNGKAFIIDASSNLVDITCPVLFKGFNATFLREDASAFVVQFVVSSTTLKSVNGDKTLVANQNSGASIIYDETNEFYLKGELTA